MSLDQFKNWALSQGQVGNPNANETYKGQCVSLVQQYLSKVYGIAWIPRGDAKDWPSNSNVLQYFDRVSSPQAGDIGVSYTINPYGHIWIYLTPNLILEQNGRTPLRATTGSTYKADAILRIKNGEDMEETQKIYRSLDQTNKNVDKLYQIVDQSNKNVDKLYQIVDQSNKNVDNLYNIVDKKTSDLAKEISRLFVLLNETNKRLDRLEKK